MRLPLLPLLLCAVPVAAPGCEKGESDQLVARLHDIDKRLDRIDRRLQAGAARPAAPPQAPRPPADSTTVYSIPVDGAPVRGNPKATVTIVEAFEFACPACEGTRPFVDQVLDKLGDRVRLVQKTFIVHPGRAEVPAYAGCAANLQGRWSEMEKLIWDDGFKARDLGRDHMVELAGRAGLDLARFEKDMDGVCVDRIKSDHADLQRIGTHATPTLYVNGRLLPARTLDAVEQLVAEEEKKAAERIARGTRPEEYYATWVVARGKKTI